MTESSTKRLAYELILSRLGDVFIHLDPRREGVEVPPWLRSQAQLVLQVGEDMPIPILDLHHNADWIKGTLSFARTPYLCTIPWSAVFVIVGDDGKGAVYPDDMPAEVKAEIDKPKQQKSKPPAKTKGGKVIPPYLRVVEGGKSERGDFHDAS